MVRCDAYVQINQFKKNLVQWEHYAIVQSFQQQKEFYEKKLSASVYNLLIETLLGVDASLYTTYTTKFSGSPHTSPLMRAPEYVQKLIVELPSSVFEISTKKQEKDI